MPPPPAVATTSLVAATLLLREPPPGIVEDDGVEETRAARPLSAAVAVRCGCNCGWCLPARNCNAFLTSGWSSLGGGGCCRVGLATGPKTAAEAAAADSRVEGGPPGCAGRSKGPLGCRRRVGQLYRTGQHVRLFRIWSNSGRKRQCGLASSCLLCRQHPLRRRRRAGRNQG